MSGLNLPVGAVAVGLEKAMQCPTLSNRRGPPSPHERERTQRRMMNPKFGQRAGKGLDVSGEWVSLRRTEALWRGSLRRKRGTIHSIDGCRRCPVTSVYARVLSPGKGATVLLKL